MQATLSTKKGVASGGRSSSSRSSRSDFGTVKADDCETSFRAVQDIAPFVEAVADVIGKSRESVVVYDPYYCKGSVSAHWKKLGFKNFVNRDADFYAQARSKETPRHDVLVTNPPYSGDHIRRLLDFATKPPLNKQPRSNHKLHQAGSSGDEIDGKEVPTFTPFAILIPTHVLAQNWVGDLLQRRGLPPMAYVAPSQQRYSFTCSPTNGPCRRPFSTASRVAFGLRMIISYSSPLATLFFTSLFYVCHVIIKNRSFAPRNYVVHWRFWKWFSYSTPNRGRLFYEWSNDCRCCCCFCCRSSSVAMQQFFY